MPYTINKSNGNILITLQDGVLDTVSLPVTLVGKNYTGYGEWQNENFVHLLENFANVNAPNVAIAGQLWFNTAANQLSVYDGTKFKVLGISYVQSSEPNNPQSGDGWWDIINEQYFIYNGTTWELVGPPYSKLLGKSGAIVDTIMDSNSNNHVVVKMMTAGNVVSIISGAEDFTPMVAIAGFGNIRKGVNLVLDSIMYGVSYDSERLGDVVAANYVRTDVTSTVTAGIKVVNDISIGSTFAANIGVNGGGSAFFKNRYTNGSLVLGVRSGSTDIESLTVDGSTGYVYVSSNPVSVMGVATKGYVDTNITTLNTNLSNTITRVNLDTNSAIVSNVATLNSTISTGLTNVNSSLTQAINANVSTLNSTIGSVNSSLTQAIDANVAMLNSNIASVNSSLTQAINANVSTLNSTIGSVNSSLTQAINANVSTLNSTIGSVNSSLTQAINANVATLNANISALTTVVNTKSPINSPIFTGAPIAPTPTANDNSGRVATTEYVVGVLSYKSNLISPNFSGIPTVPTASTWTNTTQIASTAFVQDATQYWAGSKKYVTTAAPDNNIGVNGDFWFQYV